MYLHLGQSVVVPEASIIGVFDLDNTTGSHITRKFLTDAEKAGTVVNVSEDLPKSFVLCGEGGYPPPALHHPTTVFLSQLTPQTLLKRSGSKQFV